MGVGRLSGFYVEQRQSSAAWWCRRVALFALVLAAVAIVAHRLRLVETLPFLWIGALVFGLAIAALGLAAAGFQRVWHDGDRGGYDIFFGTVIGLVLLAPYALAGWWAVAYPALTDVSTDLDDPPRLEAAAAFRPVDANPVLPLSETAKAEQIRAYPDVTGRRYPIGFDQTLAAVDMLLERRGWEIISPLQEGAQLEFTFEAFARSPLLALPYDVAVRVTDEGNATFVDMRSVSRYGDRDFGANAQLVASFLKELDVEAGTLSGAVPPDPNGEDLPNEGAPIPTPSPQ